VFTHYWCSNTTFTFALLPHTSTDVYSSYNKRNIGTVKIQKKYPGVRNYPSFKVSASWNHFDAQDNMYMVVVYSIVIVNGARACVIVTRLPADGKHHPIGATASSHTMAHATWHTKCRSYFLLAMYSLTTSTQTTAGVQALLCVFFPDSKHTRHRTNNMVLVGVWCHACFIIVQYNTLSLWLC
jgi:hypothetical protein